MKAVSAGSRAGWALRGLRGLHGAWLQIQKIKAELARQTERSVIPVEGRALFRAPESLIGIVRLGENEGYESRRDH